MSVLCTTASLQSLNASRGCSGQTVGAFKCIIAFALVLNELFIISTHMLNYIISRLYFMLQQIQMFTIISQSFSWTFKLFVVEELLDLTNKSFPCIQILHMVQELLKSHQRAALLRSVGTEVYFEPIPHIGGGEYSPGQCYNYRCLINALKSTIAGYFGAITEPFLKVKTFIYSKCIAEPTSLGYKWTWQQLERGIAPVLFSSYTCASYMALIKRQASLQMSGITSEPLLRSFTGGYRHQQATPEERTVYASFLSPCAIPVPDGNKWQRRM